MTLSAAAIIAAYTEAEPAVLLVGAASALVFWSVDALWKTNQQAFYDRSRQIEGHFRGDGSDARPFQITRSWSQSWHGHGGWKRAFAVMAWPHVFLPHLVVVLGGIVLYVLAPPPTAT